MYDELTDSIQVSHCLGYGEQYECTVLKLTVSVWTISARVSRGPDNIYHVRPAPDAEL